LAYIKTENGLRFSQALVGGHVAPLRGLAVVPRHAEPAAMHRAENELGDGEAVIGQRGSERAGRRIVFALKSREQFFEAAGASWGKLARLDRAPDRRLARCGLFRPDRTE
jgi:hypothetical protein